MTRPGDAGSGRFPAASLEPAARDQIVDALGRLFANDQIAEAELEARLDRVYRAATEPELQAILADLPGPVLAAAPGTVLAGQGAARRIDALFSGQEHRMAGVVPSNLRLRARLGYVELDLTDATFAAGVTTIEVRAFLGYVQIRFPPGVHVESHGRALFGFFSLKGGPASASDDTTRLVRIVGRATFGFVEGYTGS